MSGSTSEEKVSLTIYREYDENDFPTKVKSFKEVDFILGFVTEEYILGGGTGKFTPTWKLDGGLSPNKVKELKKNYPQVKVIISIGGVGDDYPFEPTQVDSWITTAVDSIKDIIHQYHNLIDGIDIHYDVINSSEEEFASCIGSVIRQLRDKVQTIKVVSIAPSKPVNSFYIKLFSTNKCKIDLVDYQFYKEQFFSKDEVEDLYKKLAVEYSPAKVLPGINTPPNHIIQEGIKKLMKDSLIPGYFVWNAEGSTLGDDPFSFDEILSSD